MIQKEHALYDPFLLSLSTLSLLEGPSLKKYIFFDHVFSCSFVPSSKPVCLEAVTELDVIHNRAIHFLIPLVNSSLIIKRLNKFFEKVKQNLCSLHTCLIISFVLTS